MAQVPPSADAKIQKENLERAEAPHHENVAMQVDILGSSILDENTGRWESVDPSQSRPQISERIVGWPVYAEVSMSVEEEMGLPNLRECLKIFLEGEGAKGPLFNEEIHRFKLAFFETSPYEGERAVSSLLDT